MNITSNQLKYKKIIGKSGGDPLWEVATNGGLHLIIAQRKSGKYETLGAGSHRAVARHIAKKKDSGMEITELSKSEWYPEETYIHEVPKYEALTEQLRAASGFEP